MELLEEIYRSSLGSEQKFKNRALLFIGSESYDAPAITVIQGLHRLGFTIYTLKKSNINSWFCNQVIESPAHIRIDFALSNLHWGTRWSAYRDDKLQAIPKVLIDGDDNHGADSWREKHARYCKEYVMNPPEEIKVLNPQPYRWMESLGDYRPDVVFASQKRPGDKTTIYLPFGIQDEYKTLYENKTVSERDLDFTFIPGPGLKRKRMERTLQWLSWIHAIPGRIFRGEARGNDVIPKEIAEEVAKDPNIHSYHRWVMSKNYFSILNRSRVMIYPGVANSAWWDSKRPWEAFAGGCLLLFKKPTVDMSDYPVTALGADLMFNSSLEFLEKCRFLYRRMDSLEKLRQNTYEKADRYFSSVPLARYFLGKAAGALC